MSSQKRKASELDSNTEEEARVSPIVLPCPAFVHDVRLVGFNQEFHVHSALLKIHSAFFRKFLDSPDKEHPQVKTIPGCCSDLAVPRAIDPPSFAPLKYSWVTKVDCDGKKQGWALVAERPKVRSRRHRSYHGINADTLTELMGNFIRQTQTRAGQCEKAKDLLAINLQDFQFPDWVRRIKQYGSKYGCDLEEECDTLLSNELSLLAGRDHPVPGEGNYKDHFFCTFVLNEDLPWDLDEVEW